MILHKEDFIKLREKLEKYSLKAQPIQYAYIMRLENELTSAIDKFEVNNDFYINLYNKINRFLGE